MEDNSMGLYLDITKKPMHLPDFRIARGQWLYHIGVGISRVALICQFHHSMGDINVEAVDGYS